MSQEKRELLPGSGGLTAAELAEKIKGQMIDCGIAEGTNDSTITEYGWRFFVSSSPLPDTTIKK